MNETQDYLKQICANYRLTFGSHHAGTSPWPISFRKED